MMTTAEFLVWGAGMVLLAFFGEGLALMVGYIIFSLITLGQVQIQGPEHKEIIFPWHGFARDGAGKIVVQTEIAGAIGFSALVFCGIILLYLRAQTR